MADIPVQVAKDKEKSSCWSDFRTPHGFVTFLSGLLSVNTESFELNLPVVFSESEPQAADNDKLWVKTSAPFAIGLFAEGKYEMFYKYPVGVPLAFPEGTAMTNGLSALSQSEVAAYGLTNPTNGSVWAVFDPSTV